MKLSVVEAFIAARKRSPEEIERRERLYGFMQNAQVGSMDDMKSLFLDMMPIFLE